MYALNKLSCAFILLLLVIEVHEKCSSLSPQTVTVDLKNAIGGNGQGALLEIHCKSKDKDLGDHYYAYEATYSWNISVDFDQSILYTCDLAWLYQGKMVNGSVTIYDSNRDRTKCYLHCQWFASFDGIFLTDPYTGKPQLMASWIGKPQFIENAKEVDRLLQNK